MKILDFFKKKKTTWSDEHSLQYHTKQYYEVKESTKHFLYFLQNNVVFPPNSKIIDVGCGAGAATNYIASNLQNVEFTGIDSNAEVIKIAQTHSTNRTKFFVGDILKLPFMNDVFGVISIHTLMCLPNFQKPIEEILTKLKPHWLAISSLFYPGEIGSITLLTENLRNRSVFYNTYSIPELNRFVHKFGYSVKIYQPFNISLDIPSDKNLDYLSTYTVSIKDSKEKLQISGPHLMNWYFVLIIKES
jgi:SAM-dependent methyltransferase